MHANRLFRALLVSGVVTFAGLIGCDAQAEIAANPTPPHYNYCAILSGESTVVLLDQSDPYDDLDKGAAATGVAALLDQLSPGRRLSIVTFGNNADGLNRVFQDCYPGCPPSSQFALLEMCNQRYITEDKTIFLTKAAEALKQTVVARQDSGFGNTDLARAIFKVNEAYRPNLLAVFSDFVEYRTKQKPQARFDRFTRSEFTAYLDNLAQERKIPDLRNVRFVGWGIGKSLGSGNGKSKNLIGNDQWGLVQGFWNAYLDRAQVATDARSLTIKFNLPVAGGR